MGQPLIQPTFAGGELSPSLHARVDIERYGNSVKTAKNFIVRPYGGLVNRPGFGFLGNADPGAATGITRVIPFVYSTEISYVIEMGHELMRFWANGALIESSPGVPFELATIYDEADIFAVKFTQSADVVFLTHQDYPPQKLSRLTATSFVIEDFVTKEGPFRDVNANEAFSIASSAKSGPVTLTANVAIFTSDMVGLLLYMEAKSLGQVKPWQQGDRSVVVGSLRRSDGKTYKCTEIPVGGGIAWVECGSFRPVHQLGREWDGPGDDRTNGTQTWAVGVQWEYQDSGYGIVQLTGYTNATTMTGTVLRNLPDGVVGGLGAPANTWTVSGNGVTVTFATAGATSPSNADYFVKIDGVPVQSDPNYVPPPGPDGGEESGGGDWDFIP